MTAEEKKKKLDWLRDLPIEILGTTSFSRTCPCGNHLLIEAPVSGVRTDDEERVIWSWIDSHFGHSAPRPQTRKFSPADLYDFKAGIKFSRKGYEMFRDEFGLVIDEQYPVSDYDKFTDKKGNVFVFCKFLTNCDVEGVAAVFLPKVSSVDVLRLGT